MIASRIEHAEAFLIGVAVVLLGSKVWQRAWMDVFELTSYFFFGVALIWAWRRWG